MRNNLFIFILITVFETLKSCLVPPAPIYHDFVSSENIGKVIPKVKIFSTPRYKQYVVTGVDTNVQVFIKSPVFVNPDEYYAMKNKDFFKTKAKQFELYRSDGKFYQDTNFKHIILKINNGESERIITYSMANK